MLDVSQELPLLRRLAVALWESRRSGSQNTVSRLLAEWCDLTGWGGKGGVSLVVDSVVDLEVDGVVDGQGSVNNTVTLGKDRAIGEKKNGARHTWLSPYLSAFRSAYGENQVGQGIGRMARVFSVLEKSYARDDVVARFGNYLASTPAQWYSIERFETTFPAWKSTHKKPSSGGPPDPEPSESVDSYIARLAKLGF